MKFSYNWLRELVDVKETSEQLAEVLTMKSFEVEGVEKADDDYLLDVKLSANLSADFWGHRGLAREISFVTGRPLKKIPEDSFKENGALNASEKINVEIQRGARCSFYAARYLDKFQNIVTPDGMREKLEKLSGSSSGNILIDATSFALLELGHPTHVFDADKVKGKIIVRVAGEGEEMTTLDGQILKLTNLDLIIADEEGILALAGVKGGKKAEVGKNTKAIIIESALFESGAVRQTARRHNLRTDAVMRFERGSNEKLAAAAIDRVAGLIQDASNARLAKGLAQTGPAARAGQAAALRIIKLNENFFERLAGVAIEKSKAKIILEKAGFVIEDKKGEWRVMVPVFRADIDNDQALAREVLRVIGFNGIKSTLPTGVLIPPIKNDNWEWSALARNILASNGYSECYNYSFVSEKEAARVAVSDIAVETDGVGQTTAETGQAGGGIELENPVRMEQSFLRPTLIFGLVKKIQASLKHRDRVRLFEIGRVFGGKDGMTEISRLSGIISSKGGSGEDLFFEIKGTLEFLFEGLGITDYRFDGSGKKKEDGLFDPDLSAEVKIGEEVLGRVGRIKKDISGSWELEEEVIGFELSIGEIFERASRLREYAPPPKFPAIERDLAILFDQGIRVGDVLSVLQNGGGPLLENADLFDIYDGAGVPEGKESMAFRLVFRSADKTLKDEEVNEIMERIIKIIEENLEGEVRR